MIEAVHIIVLIQNSGGAPSNVVTTDAGDPITTDAGDYIVTDN